MGDFSHEIHDRWASIYFTMKTIKFQNVQVQENVHNTHKKIIKLFLAN